MLIVATTRLRELVTGVAIDRRTLHHEGLVRDPLTSVPQVSALRSGRCCWIVRFDLADGRTRAIGVGYPGISEQPIALDAP